ncbi:hypothetical protein Taro_010118 [Colocasia esculenta]|uniref:Disease resistance R13L4/SHOC-2-like LRR domain-containing protein n=1 Tax=Colocasia esculenta TaxID=4460 RepID=A0A843U620_COLES|nr:hypothetical protein [Colocasia esculenta]
MFWYSDHSFHLSFPVNDLKLLRVLNVNGSNIRKLPKQIGLLVHLRFLGLEETCIDTLPSFIGMLRNLQTLRLGTSRKNVNCMANLQTLGCIIAGNWMGRCLGEFTNLRIDKVIRMVAKFVLAALVNCNVMHELDITPFSYGPNIRCSDYLSTLVGRKSQMQRQLNRQQHQSLQFPSSLIQLILCIPNLLSEQEGLASLQCLPNLKILRLSENAYSGKVMVFSPQEFTKLEELLLQKLEELEQCIIDNGAMPCLKRLTITYCRKLKTLPEGLQHITTLQELQLSDMPDEFIRRLKEKREEEWLVIPNQTWHYKRFGL